MSQIHYQKYVKDKKDIWNKLLEVINTWYINTEGSDDVKGAKYRRDNINGFE